MFSKTFVTGDSTGEDDAQVHRLMHAVLLDDLQPSDDDIQVVSAGKVITFAFYQKRGPAGL